MLLRMNKGRTNPLDILEEEPSGDLTKALITGDSNMRISST
jgi:hypothetical protein